MRMKTKMIVVAVALLLITSNLTGAPFTGWQSGAHNGTGGNNPSQGLEFEFISGTNVRVRRGNINAANSGNSIHIPSSVRINAVNYNVIEIAGGSDVDDGFSGHTALHGFTKELPNITRIGNEAFRGTGLQTNVTIQFSVAFIGDGAFREISNRPGSLFISLPNNPAFTTISANLFDGSTNLLGVSIPPNVTRINTAAFQGTSLMGHVGIPNTVTAIDTYAFSGITTSSFNITLPNNPEFNTISGHLFYNSTGLTSVTIPNTVRFIRNSAFNNTRLARLVIPEGVTTIESDAINNISTLSSIIIPNSVVNIGNNGLSNPNAGLVIYVERTEANKPSGWNDLFHHSNSRIVWDIASRKPRDLALNGTELYWAEPDMTGIVSGHIATIFTGYRIFKDGEFHANVPFGQNTLTVTLPGEYTIRTVFTTGNVSRDYAFIAPKPVSLYAPFDNAALDILEPTLIWINNDEIDAKDGFRVYVSLDPDFDNVTPAVLMLDDPAQTTFEVDVLEYFTVYYWRVIPFRGNYDAAPNQVWRFITPKPDVPDDEIADHVFAKDDLDDLFDDPVSFLDEVILIQNLMMPELPALGIYDFYVDVLLIDTLNRSVFTKLYLRVSKELYDEVDALEGMAVNIQGLFRFDENKDLYYVLLREPADISSADDNDELSVTFSTFTANVINSSTVSLNWATASETNMRGFHLLRKDVSGERSAGLTPFGLQNVGNVNDVSDAIRITHNIIPATNTSMMSEYRFYDENVQRGAEYLYWIQAIVNDGAIMFHGPISVLVKTGEVVPNLPLFTAVSNVFPNPVRNEANFSVSVKEGETAVLKIFNVRGQLVREFADIREGERSIKWDRRCSMGNEVGSGVYFIRLISPTVESVQRMVLMK